MWRLYYTDHSRFTSDDGPWADAPAWGVGLMAVPNADTGVALPTGDFYIWPDHVDSPYAADAFGLIDMLLTRRLMAPHRTLLELTPRELVNAGVKFGRSMDYDDWRHLWNRVLDDVAGWGGKHGHHRWERVPA